MNDEEWQSWTSCEMFGHVYKRDDDDEVFDHCLDCGHERDPGR